MDKNFFAAHKKIPDALSRIFFVAELTAYKTMCAITKPTQQPLMTPIKPGIMNE